MTFAIAAFAIAASCSTGVVGATPNAAQSPPGGALGFSWSVGTITAAQIPYTWHKGCPVAPSALRAVHVRFFGFDAHAHQGEIIVNVAVVAPVVSVFERLYARKFPIRHLAPADAYRGNDNASMAADNTSGFNCRLAVAPGPPTWSVHAFGEAIDVNPRENPYVLDGHVLPPQGGSYVDRRDLRPGMSVLGGPLVQAFAAVGWQWGGRWASAPDYQHFSANGR